MFHYFLKKKKNNVCHENSYSSLVFLCVLHLKNKQIGTLNIAGGPPGSFKR